MALAEGDYLKWYNKEITRYRNQEWQLVLYSVAFSSAVILFVRRSETKGLIEPCIAAFAIGALVLLLIIAEFHVHSRLNEYRQRRELLLESGDHRAKKVKVCFLKGWFDALYFLSFVLFPAIFGLAAVQIVIAK